MKSKRNTADYPIGQYKRLYGERTDRLEYGYLFSELLETRSRQFDWKIEPHIHPGLFQVFFVGTGSFDFYEAAEKRRLEAPCIVLIPPTALHGFHFSNDSTGRILSLAGDMMEDLCQSADFLKSMLGTTVCLTDFGGMYSAEQIKKSFIRLDVELFTNETGKAVMLQACLHQLFIMLFRLWKVSKNTDTAQDPVVLGYFEKFQRLIRQVNAGQTVKAIAAEVGISPVHLNRICNQMADKSAGQLLDDRLLEESKKYLSYTSYSISEIAYLLHFEYPNYFARFFRKRTALSPSEFRQQLNSQF